MGSGASRAVPPAAPSAAPESPVAPVPPKDPAPNQPRCTADTPAEPAASGPAPPAPPLLEDLCDADKKIGRLRLEIALRMLGLVKGPLLIMTRQFTEAADAADMIHIRTWYHHVLEHRLRIVLDVKLRARRVEGWDLKAASQLALLLDPATESQAGAMPPAKLRSVLLELGCTDDQAEHCMAEVSTATLVDLLKWKQGLPQEDMLVRPTHRAAPRPPAPPRPAPSASRCLRPRPSSAPSPPCASACWTMRATTSTYRGSRSAKRARAAAEQSLPTPPPPRATPLSCGRARRRTPRRAPRAPP